MMNLAQFHHRMPLHVRHYEVDWQGIVHNVNYLLYFELGRVGYLKAVGAAVDLNSLNGPSKVVLVRNEIDYRSSARFDDELNVHTRIRKIGTTSFVMEGVIVRASDGIALAENVAYHVWLDPANDRPTPIPPEFRALVHAFEKE